MSSDQVRPRRRGFSVLGPAILIGLGIIFLLNSLDLVPWSTWATLWRFWPIILILLGVQVILGRMGAGWGVSLLAAVLLVVVVVGAAAVVVRVVGVAVLVVVGWVVEVVEW